MSILSQIETATLENYIKADDKLQYINSLTSGTYSRQVLEQVHTLNLHKSELSEQQQQSLSRFIDQYGIREYNQEARAYRQCHEVDLTHLLYKLQDGKTTQSQKEEILNTIRLYYIKLMNCFDHTRPVELGNQGNQQQQNVRPTVYTEEKIENYMQRCFQDIYTIKNMNKNYSHFMDFEKVLKMIDYDQVRRYIDIIKLARIGENGLRLLQRWYDLVERHYKQQSESNRTTYSPPNFPQQFYEQITLEQLEKLPQYVKRVESDNYYYITLFQKKFSDVIEQITKIPLINKDEEEIRERREAIQEIYSWVKTNFKHKAQSQILWICQYDLFNLDHYTNTQNLDTFVKILKEAPFGLYDFPYYYRYKDRMEQINRDSKENYKQEKSQWNSINVFKSDWLDSRELCEKYIRKFSNNIENIKELVDILEPNYVYKIYYEEQLYSGVQFDEFPTVLKGNEQNLIDEKEIQFLYTNKKYFKPGDHIQLQVSIKNIPKYTVSLFEIDIETYYRENLREFDTGIPLEGVIPSEQFVIEDRDAPAIKKVIKTLEFPSIKDIKRGIFIVDIMGNGISSRAVIKKGSLLSIQEQTAAGTRFTILSEDGQICTSQDGTSGLILNKIFHKSDEKGQVVIPFGSLNQNYDAILVHGNFAVLTSAEIKSENYELKCAYLYIEEQFLEGNKAKILIQPRLYINGIATTVALLNNVSISAVSRNLEGIPNTTKHNNVKFDFTKEYELEIPIKSQTQSINISIKAQVNYLTGKKCDLQSSHSVDINLHNNQEKFTNLYLRKSSDKGFKVLFLGKNAEPKVKQDVVITLKLKYKRDTDTQTLHTDENGAVNLGNLQYVSYVTAQFSELGNLERISKTWNIDDQDSQYDYPSQILITEKDHIKLPFLFEKLNYGTCNILKIQKNHNMPLQDYSRNILLQNNQITISNLAPGFYTLSFPLLDLNISVEVIKGKYWENNPNFIIDDKFNVVESIGNKSNNLAVLKKADFFKSKENPELSDIKLQTILPENISAEGVLGVHRAHIYATSFIPNEIDKNTMQLRSGIIQPGTIQSQLQMQQSLYLNSKQLGDEICYVIDRKDQKKYIGNTLEKPQILLKRTLVKDTNFNQETLAADQDYGTRDIQLQQQGQVIREVHEKKIHGGRYRNTTEKGCESFLNFLQNSSMIMSNIPINQDGSIILRNFPIKQYSTLFVVVNNLEAVVQQQIDLPESELQTKDLRLKSQLNKDKHYSIARDGKYLKASENTKIPQDAENIIINNVEQLFDIQKELSVNNSVSEREVNYSQWRFLQDWSSYNIQQKQEKYNEFASHELNIFIYFKDQAFFESVVKNFLQNKIEKTFVDYFLLGNTQQVLEYAQIGTFNKLNVMEQCLLLLVLVQKDKQKAQKFYTSRFENILKAKPVNVDYFNSLFDTIMLSKKQDSPIVELPQDIEEEKEYYEREEEQRRMSINNENCEVEKMQYFEEECVQMKQCAMNFNEEFEEEDEEEMCQEIQCEGFNYQEQSQQFSKKLAAPSNMMMAMNDKNIITLENQRKQYKPGFQNVDKTQEYMETTYYGQISPEYSSRVTLNQFWADAASHIIQTGSLKSFISINFIYASENNTALVAALAFIDLNYSEKANFQMITTRDRQIDIKSESNSMIFVKEVKETIPQLQSNITVTQRYFDPKDRYIVLENDPGVSVEKKVEEFLEDKIYGSQVITTNCSISNLEFQILHEIPEGAIPVKNLDYTKSFTQHINSYQTKTSEFFFYFPSTGRFRVYPSNASRKGRVLSIAPELPMMDVKKEKTIFKDESFIDILQKGNKNEILNFIATKNILNNSIFKFEYIYWLLNDKQFFSRYIQILKDRQIYDNISYSYCFKHTDFEGAWQYIKQNNVLQKQSKVLYFKSANLSYNSQQLLEYHPLLSNRVHNFMNQNKQKILNEEFKSQYFRFLQNVAYTVPHLEAYHFIVFAYYLLLQERIEEAIQMHAKIQKQDITGKWVIQYDYLTAYLDIYVGYPNFVQARQISEKYSQYPVISWRNLFKEVQNQLTEFDGDIVEEQVKDSEYSKNQKVAISEEHFNVALDETKLVINHANLKEVKVKYFVLDLEILFSRSPFLSQQQSQFTYVKPNKQQVVNLGNQPDITKLMHPIPEQLQNKNLYIQISSGQNLENLNYFSNQLKVHVLERLGQVKVTDQQNRPLSKVYVKSYARQGSQEVFYRDGYTDMRGRYDYALSSNSDISNVNRFAILIVSEEYGSCIKEAGKPSTQGTYTA